MDTVEILQKLVGFPTISRTGNLELMDFIADYLEGFGIRSELIHSEDKTRANLHAIIGPQDIPGVMVSGHTDVVPVDGQDWSRDPFIMHHDNGRYYGRGTCDMKGFIACVLAAVPHAAAGHLKHPLHLAFSYDEEIGCIGVRRMIDVMMDAPVKPAFCIIGEPTSMEVAIGHKGKVDANCLCSGTAAHSALHPTGANAIYLASDMIRFIRDLQERIEKSGNRDDHFAVPVTTLHVGVIEGGTALNIVPDHCRFRFEIRHLAGDDPHALISEISQRGEELAVEFQQNGRSADVTIEITNSYPGLETAPDAEIVSFVKSLTGRNGHCKVAFGTEGGLFRERLGIPTVVCGPGSMDQGHKPDEFVTSDQIESCNAFMGALIDRLSNDHIGA